MGWNSKDYLMHHGIKGQKWGVRRFQNKDGTRTSLGKSRYVTKGVNQQKPLSKEERKAIRKKQKEEKLKEQGKKLYEKGHTIEANEQLLRNVKKGAGLVSALGATYLSQTLIPKLETTSMDHALTSMSTGEKASAAAIVASAAAVSVTQVYTAVQNKKMRTYWHSRGRGE